jgi:hypothetical protein
MYNGTMTKLFISHAAHDKVLVEAVVDLLESGVGVPHQSIFCSSLKGQSIKPGEDFVKSIRQSLGEATCVMALISDQYYASAFCMCELGGVWLQAKSFLPVLVPPVDYNNLKAVLSGLQVSRIASEEDLDELRDELIERLGIEGHKTPRWSSRRKAFLQVLPKRLKAIKFKGPVSRAEYGKLEKELETYREEYEAREHEIDELKNLVGELKNAKDATAVAKIVSKHSSVVDQFKSLVSAASNALDGLARPVQEACYYRMRGEDYVPKDWDEVERPLEYGELAGGSNDHGLRPNEENRKIQSAMVALDKLARWLERSPDEFEEWYDEETDGERPHIKLRGFWDRHLW